MKYYAFIENGKINGCGQCKILNDDILNIEVNEEIYNNIEKYIYQDGEIVLNPNYEEELEQKERERIAKLYLTGADVERGIYQAKGMDFDDIVALVTQLQPQGLDIKALKIELKANNFYRGNPYVSAIGQLLGFSEEQLDKFFEFNDHFYLMKFDLEVKTTPENAIVKINGVETKTASLPFDSEYVCEIYCEGYITQILNGKIQNDEYIEVVLESNTPTEELNIENLEEV